MSRSPTTTDIHDALAPPVHPGEILAEDFLKPLHMTQYRLARALRVYPRRVNEIVLGKRAVTADTALRLARYFGTSAELWLNLQAQYDLACARDQSEERVMAEVTPMSAAAQTVVDVRV